MGMARTREPQLDRDYGYLGTWEEDGFRLRLWDTGHRLDASSVGRGKPVLRYELVDSEFDEQPVFQGDDFAVSPLHVVDSDEALGGLLSFLSLQPGDTDDEYFDRYDARQRRWLETGRAESLGIIAFDLENPPAEVGVEAGIESGDSSLEL
jgi:hypothetical protein